MHFMMIAKATEESGVDLLRDGADLSNLLEFHDSMQRAGVVLSVEALQPPCRAVHVRYSGDRRIIANGAVSEEKQYVVGFWLIRVNSLQEATEWAKRVPLVNVEIEVRPTVFQLFPASDDDSYRT
jgi:hypothetical protein